MRHKGMSKIDQIDEIERAKDEIRNAVRSGLVTKAQIAVGTGYHRNTMLDLHLSSWNPKTNTLSAILAFVRRHKRVGNGARHRRFEAMRAA
jgi:hypothetical protein